MKKHSFLAGMLTMALIVGLGISALAATGQVSFNASALSLNGSQISAKGENYTLANGQSVPASITYTDEKGGGTTYLPVRRIAELLGVETGWDGATGSVTVKGETTTPPENTATLDYSDWSKEDEAAYQEFKGYWNVGLGDYNNPEKDKKYHIVATLKSPQETVEIAALWNSMSADVRERFSIRLIDEYYVTLSPISRGYVSQINKPNSVWIGFVSMVREVPQLGGYQFQHHDFD